MITSWRSFPPSPRQEQEPKPEPHIWDQVTVEQNAKMQKSADDLGTVVTSMIEGLPEEQQSVFKNYMQSRAASGREAKVK